MPRLRRRLTAGARWRSLRGLASTPQHSAARAGVIATTTAFLLWGVFPLYWKLLHGIDAFELIAHRIVWSLVFLIPIVVMRGTWGNFLGGLRNGASLRLHALSGVLLAINWLTYVWAVNADRIIETALGYFLNPLVSVVLGIVFLRERLRPAQGVALAIATAGVALLIVRYGQLPWISLTLAITFGFYGLLRKRSTLGSLSGLTLETSILLPVALGFLLWQHADGVGALGHIGALQTSLVFFTGIVTAVPLLFFAQGARLIPLSTVGLLQYIAPSVQFAIGIAVYHEPLPPERLWAFCLIWAALALYSVDSFKAARRAGQNMR